MDYMQIFSAACEIQFSNTSEFYNCVEYKSYTKEEIILGTIRNLRIQNQKKCHT